MTHIIAGYAAALICAMLAIGGDYLIKLAADNGHSAVSPNILIGGALYATSAFAWFWAMQHVSMAQAGVAYAMFTLLALCVIGAVMFGEVIQLREVVGICCALAAVVLMVRFT